MPGGKLSDVMLLVIGIVGTTVAPWQLFFQQSYVIDKRITPRFMKLRARRPVDRHRARHRRRVAIMAFGATFAGRPNSAISPTPAASRGHRAMSASSAGRDVRHRADRRLADRRLRGVAVDGLRDRRRVRLRHSLHRKVTDAKGFYAVYCRLIASRRRSC
jgi:hypothetical protein